MRGKRFPWHTGDFLALETGWLTLDTVLFPEDGKSLLKCTFQGSPGRWENWERAQGTQTCSPREKDTYNKATVLNSQAVAEALHFQGDPRNILVWPTCLEKRLAQWLHPLSDRSMRWRLFFTQAKSRKTLELRGGFQTNEDSQVRKSCPK